ncbi:hypothetical protein B0H13DRAFT_1879678 [Mycena leptocephala]|nr:hypothetical protein B0H13DRAFT_1879678 [Mycena leptocephala]
MNIPARSDVDDGINQRREMPVLGPPVAIDIEIDVGRDRFGWDRDMELGLGIAIIDRKGVGWEGVDHWQGGLGYIRGTRTPTHPPTHSFRAQSTRRLIIFYFIFILWPAVARDPSGADGLVRDAKEQTPPPPPPPPHIPRVPELEFEPANQRPGMQSPRKKRRILPFPSSCIMIPNSNDAPVGYVHYTGMRTERIQDTGFRVGYSAEGFDKQKIRCVKWEWERYWEGIQDTRDKYDNEIYIREPERRKEDKKEGMRIGRMHMIPVFNAGWSRITDRRDGRIRDRDHDAVL